MRFMKDGSRATYPYRDFSSKGHALAMKKALDIRSDFNVILVAWAHATFPYNFFPLFSSALSSLPLFFARISALNGSRGRVTMSRHFFCDNFLMQPPEETGEQRFER